jgi:hypothetical protein
VFFFDDILSLVYDAAEKRKVPLTICDDEAKKRGRKKKKPPIIPR